jgi:hypothetical protein
MKLGDTVAWRTNPEFVGRIYAITDYEHGCRRIGVKPLLLKDGLPQDGIWFDEPELIVIEQTDAPVATMTGGPRSDDGRSDFR